MSGELNLNEMTDQEKRVIYNDLRKRRVPYSKMTDDEKAIHNYINDLRKKNINPDVDKYIAQSSTEYYITHLKRVKRNKY